MCCFTCATLNTALIILIHFTNALFHYRSKSSNTSRVYRLQQTNNNVINRIKIIVVNKVLVYTVNKETEHFLACSLSLAFTHIVLRQHSSSVHLGRFRDVSSSSEDSSSRENDGPLTSLPSDSPSLMSWSVARAS